MKAPNIIDLVRHHKVAAAVAGAVLLVLVIFAFMSISDWWAGRSIEKQDQRLEKQINTAETKATTSEANANQHGDDAKAAEGRHARSLEQWQAAGENSNRSAEQVRKARQRNEENRDRTITGPAFTDAELCAELAKRGIANPCHQP